MRIGGTMAIKQEENHLDSNPISKGDQTASNSQSGGGFYEIHVKGHLHSEWSDWLEGLEMRLLDNGEMILSGNIVDQAALLGVLIKLSRLNLTLLSVNEVKRSN
jgi:hypothetical protein